MECPNCKEIAQVMKELSRGMGNQAYYKCAHCGTVALWSGVVLTRYWPPTDGQEGGSKCLADLATFTLPSDISKTAAPIET